MTSGREAGPAAEIRVVWNNFPYKSAMDSIGEGRVQPQPPSQIPVPPEDTAWLRERAAEIYGKAGLYDAHNGSGTITISVTSYGRWTYGELFRSFLVDTGWIMIIPASLRTNYRLTAEYRGPSGTAAAETAGRNKTTFHALLFPLYPFLPPGSAERSLLKKMLWRSASDIYTKASRNGAAAR